MQAMLMYYFKWDFQYVKSLSDNELSEAFQNLIYVREQEAKASEK